MSDLAAPFLAVFPGGPDALAFWAFEALMRRAARNFRSDEQGIQCAPPRMPAHALSRRARFRVCSCVLVHVRSHGLAVGSTSPAQLVDDTAIC